MMKTMEADGSLFLTLSSLVLNFPMPFRAATFYNSFDVTEATENVIEY